MRVYKNHQITKGRTIFLILCLIVVTSCDEKKSLDVTPEPTVKPTPKEEGLIVGGDFSILKKMQDEGGEYKINGVKKDPIKIFSENGYTYARLRIFHTPNMIGPVVNSLGYTIALAKKFKASGMKLLLDFHYSDSWADPEKQKKPKAWEGLSLEKLKESLRQYTKDVIVSMISEGVPPDMVQLGNEITGGMIWPEGKVYTNNTQKWTVFTDLLKEAILGVEAGYGNDKTPIMIHIDRGGDAAGTAYFFDNMDKYGVKYDIIGLSYYPWWHGKFSDLETNLSNLSKNRNKDIMIVETAYYVNGYYPSENSENSLKWSKPYPSTEQGQYEFLKKLKNTVEKYPKVKAIFYWKPDGLKISKSGVTYLGRSLFDENGNAYKGIGAL